MNPSSSPPVLTAERILTAAEDVVRRHGPAKATVVDVALALGVSHASIYRFFPTKAALREAVVSVWLGRMAQAQEALLLEGTAVQKLKAWFLAFLEQKRAQKNTDPELFEAFRQLSSEAAGSVEAYKTRLTSQLARLIELGIEEGEIEKTEPLVLARVLLSAMTRFHHPALSSVWDSPSLLSDFENLWSVLERGISSSSQGTLSSKSPS